MQARAVYFNDAHPSLKDGLATLAETTIARSAATVKWLVGE
jgi:hypothetical protein